MINIRAASDRDVAAIVTVFSASVHQLAARSYTPEQLAAWAPQSPDLQQWQARLAPLNTLVADIDGILAGFIAYSSSGHIDLLYTSPAFSRQGVASQLYGVALQTLHTQGIRNLSTEASLEARPFFEKMGFSLVEEQIVERDGVQLRRFAMTLGNPLNQPNLAD